MERIAWWSGQTKVINSSSANFLPSMRISRHQRTGILYKATSSSLLTKTIPTNSFFSTRLPSSQKICNSCLKSENLKLILVHESDVAYTREIELLWGPSLNGTNEKSSISKCHRNSCLSLHASSERRASSFTEYAGICGSTTSLSRERLLLWRVTPSIVESSLNPLPQSFYQKVKSSDPFCLQMKFANISAILKSNC